MSNNKLPPGAIPGEVFVRKEKQCKTCTHYESEHMDNEEHCLHVMYYLPNPKGFPAEAVRARKLCDCKEFVVE